MNVFDSCLRRIRREIPGPILMAAFAPKDVQLFRAAAGIDDEIRKRVFLDFVLPEISRMGQYDELDLDQLHYTNDTQDYYSRVYYIDESKTGGREIVAAHIAVTPVAGQAYTIPPAGSYLNGSCTGVLSSTQQVVDSQSAMPRISSPEIKILSPNVIRIKDPGMFVYATRIMVKFALSEDLNEIKPAFYGIIADLMLYATRQYIYNKLMFDMDYGKIDNGMEFGSYRSFVEKWEDAGDMFNDTLPAVQRALVHNDTIGNRYNYMNGGRFKA